MSAALYSTASLKDMNALPFSAMTGRLHPALLRSLQSLGYEYQTPVQQKVLSELPNYRSDCLVQAKTGTGKTIAFLLPTLHSVLTSTSNGNGQVQILILSPTRELAQQIAKECDQLTSQLHKRLECHTAFGGTSRDKNLSYFMRGNPSILVATPGRLKDYLSESGPRAKLEGIQTLILDEADTMLEQGFLEDVKAILNLLPPKSTGWQGMCFSATLPAKVKSVISHVLSPNYISISTLNENEPPTLANVLQYSILIPNVVEIFTAMMSIIESERSKSSKIILFGATARMIALFARVFDGLTELKVYELHSRLSQAARTRTTNEFKQATSGLLFASDVIGRGMDFPNVDLVIQVGLPSSGEQYIHRVGRTARAGNDGKAIILLTQAESFFLKRNPQLPIKPHPQSSEFLQNHPTYAGKIENAMNQIDEATKASAYVSYLGFFAGSGFLKALQIDKAGLVRMCNDLAVRGMYCPEPPAVQKSTVGKMGLKGIPGIRIGPNFEVDHRHNRPSNKRQRGPNDIMTPASGQNASKPGRGSRNRPIKQPQSS